MCLYSPHIYIFLRPSAIRLENLPAILSSSLSIMGSQEKNCACYKADYKRGF